MLEFFVKTLNEWNFTYIYDENKQEIIMQINDDTRMTIIYDV
jgi:hypothetical protein